MFVCRLFDEDDNRITTDYKTGHMSKLNKRRLTCLPDNCDVDDNERYLNYSRSFVNITYLAITGYTICLVHMYLLKIGCVCVRLHLCVCVCVACMDTPPHTQCTRRK